MATAQNYSYKSSFDREVKHQTPCEKTEGLFHDLTATWSKWSRSKKLPNLKLNAKLLGGINLFSIFSVNMYYFAFGIRRLHIPQIGSPFFSLSLISSTCIQILAGDVSDITQAVQKDPVLIEAHVLSVTSHIKKWLIASVSGCQRATSTGACGVM